MKQVGAPLTQAPPLAVQSKQVDSLDLLTRLAERLLSAHSLEEMGLA